MMRRAQRDVVRNRRQLMAGPVVVVRQSFAGDQPALTVGDNVDLRAGVVARDLVEQVA